MVRLVWKKMGTARHPRSRELDSTGFTLVELMIVVGIIGIIASVAIPIYRNYVGTARQAKEEAVLMQIPILLEQYRAESPSGDLCPATPCAGLSFTDAAITAFLPGFTPSPAADGINYSYTILFDGTGEAATLTVTLTGNANTTYSCSYPAGTCP